MDSTELLQNRQLYFNEGTSNELRKEFIKNMYLSLFSKMLFIQCSLYIPYSEYGGYFFHSFISGGLFVIFAYILFICSALLYSNFIEISNYDITLYSYLLTLTFSYLFTYLTYYFDTPFFILNTHYLTMLFLSIFMYTYQTRYPYYYNNLIKVSFISQLMVFLVMSMIYDNFQYILLTYLTSSIAKLYILTDTECMVTKEERKFPIKVDQYLSGTILLYLDLFGIFPYLIKMFNGI